MLNTTGVGRSFENYVAALYESFGYDVTRHVVIGNQEIDVVAEMFVPGSGRIRLLIECKYIESGSISNQTVQTFAVTAEALSIKEQFNKAILVTNRTFAPGARASQNLSSRIELLTKPELENHALNARGTLLQFVQQYPKQPIYKEYIDLGASHYLNDSYTDRFEYKSALTYIFNSIDSNTNAFLTVLGDYGAGKTTLLNRLKYEASRRYVAGDNTLKPLFFPLREFFRFQNLEHYVSWVLQEEFKRLIPSELFFRALRESEFLLLLDGFDEMSDRTDDNVRLRNLLALKPLLCNGSPAVLTCRPTYYISHQQFLRGLDHIQVRLQVKRTRIKPTVPLVTETAFQSMSQRPQENERAGWHAVIPVYEGT
jgi:hypothetical protein